MSLGFGAISEAPIGALSGGSPQTLTGTVFDNPPVFPLGVASRAVTLDDWFAPPNLASGDFSSSAITAIDEWPFSQADALTSNTISASGSATLGLRFDLSNAPGAKKGFRFWFWPDAGSNDFTIDEIRVIDGNGPTTLLTDSSPGLPTVLTDVGVFVYDIDDSAWTGDPDLDQIIIEVDVTNNLASTNTISYFGARLSKSPFTTSQEADLPSTLAGEDFMCFRASDLPIVGLSDGNQLVVWPDASGKGRHAVRWVGTDLTYEADTIDYVNCPASHDTRFLWVFNHNSPINDNVVTHIRHYPTTITSDHPIITAVASIGGGVQEIEGALGAGSPGEKLVHGYSSSDYLLMWGDGSGPAHLLGGTPTIDTWARSTVWGQISGNEHLWEDDDASPVIDGASGANQLHAGSFFHHEATDRQFEGRIAEIWVIHARSSTVTEADIDTARDEWVAGLSDFLDVTVHANGTGTIASVVDEADTTTNLHESVDDDPTSPNDTDWVNNTVDTASVFFDLENMPTGFGNAETASLVVRRRMQVHSSGSYRLFAALFRSNETTPLSDEVVVATHSANSSFANTVAIAFTGLDTSASKAVWDGAKIRFRWAKL